jgi:hypothetical protein
MKMPEVETVGALEDRYRDRRLAARLQGRAKKRTQDDSGSQQKLVSPRGRLTRRAVPALRKGPSRRGAGKTTGNGIRRRSRRQGLRLGSNKTLCEAGGQTRVGGREAGGRDFHQVAGSE